MVRIYVSTLILSLISLDVNAQEPEPAIPPIQLDTIFEFPGNPGEFGPFSFPGLDSLFGTGVFQPKRYTENEISVEELFISANQKKLLGKYEEALEIYQSILKKDELNATVHHDMARIYLAIEDGDKAITSARKAVRFDPTNHWYKLTLVEIYESTLHYDDAAKLLEKTVQKISHEQLYQRWATNLEYSNQIKDAIGVYDQTDQLFGWDELRSDHKVDLWLQLNNEKEALAEVKKWSEKYPTNVVYLVKLARYYEFRNQLKKSIAEYQKVLDLQPDHEEALVKTSVAKSSGSSDLERLVNDTRVGIDNKILAIIPELENPDVDIIALCASMINQYPESAKVYALSGDAYWLSGDVTSAIKQYESSLSRSKSVYQVWDQLMMALTIEQSMNKLLDVATEAMDYYPNQAGPYYYQALGLFANNELEDAIEINEEAIFIASANTGYISEQSLILKARILNEQGKSADALESLESLNDQAKSAPILEMIGDLYYQAGDKKSAESLWQEALKKGGDKSRITQKIQSI